MSDGLKHMTATEVEERMKAMSNRPHPEYDAALEKAFGPVIQRMLDFFKKYEKDHPNG